VLHPECSAVLLFYIHRFINSVLKITSDWKPVPVVHLFEGSIPEIDSMEDTLIKCTVGPLHNDK